MSIAPGPALSSRPISRSAARASSTLRSRAWTVLRFLFGVSMLVYLQAVGIFDWKAVGGLARFPAAALTALALLAGVLVLTSWRLCLLLRAHGIPITGRSVFKLNLIGAFFNTFLPGGVGGDAVKIYTARDYAPGKTVEFGTTAVLDRFVGLLGMATAPLLVAPFFPGLLLSPVVQGALAFAGSVAAGLLTLGAFAILQPHYFPWLVPWRGNKMLNRIMDTLARSHRSLGVLGRALAISWVGQAVLFAAMAAMLSAVSATGWEWEAAMLTPLGFLINCLPITPGGLGVGEIGFDVLYAQAGIIRGAEALIAWRTLTTVLDVGGLYFFLQRRATSGSTVLKLHFADAP